MVKPGDQVEAVVLEVHPKDRRISLGLKQLEPNPWTTIDSRYSVGSVVEGRVRNMTDFGAFIEIEEGIDGLVHVSDLSWTKRVKHPSRGAEKGADRAGGDSEYRFRRRTAFRSASSNFSRTPGRATSRLIRWAISVHGRVCRLASFGAFVELAEGVEGLCHFSEVPGYSGRRGAEEPPIHDRRRVRFQDHQDERGGEEDRPQPARRADDEEKNRLEDYQRQAAAATTTIEEVMSLKDRNLRITCKSFQFKRYCGFVPVFMPGECDDEGRSD